MSEFTEDQLENFKEFVRIQKSGIINMFDARTGCELTGMERDDWMFCMNHYDALSEAVEED